MLNYHRDELTDEQPDANGANKNITNSKSFKNKTSITGSNYNVTERIINKVNIEVDSPAYDADKRGTKNFKIAVPLKHLNNFWDSLSIPLVNCEVSSALSWFADCVVTSREKD